MGTWDTGILDDDMAADFYAEYLELRQDATGRTAKTITQMFGSEDWDKKEELDKHEDYGFWLAIAAVQAERRKVDPRLRAAVEYIITEGKDLEAWKQRGASKEDIAARKKVLKIFLQEVTGKRKRKALRYPKYLPGDTLAYKLKDGSYVGLIVIEAINDYEKPYNRLVITNIRCRTLPPKHMFKRAKIIGSAYRSFTPFFKMYLTTKLRGSLHSIGSLVLSSSYGSNSEPVTVLSKKSGRVAKDLTEADFLALIARGVDDQNLTWLPVRTIGQTPKEKLRDFALVIIGIGFGLIMLALLLGLLIGLPYLLIRFIISLV